jgi:hypothetical protein
VLQCGSAGAILTKMGQKRAGSKGGEWDARRGRCCGEEGGRLCSAEVLELKFECGQSR